LDSIKQKRKLEFYGGGWVSFLPFLFFIAIAVYISVLKAPDIKGMWVGAVTGIIVTFFFAKDKMRYSEVIIEGMSDELAITPVACWIFAGLFATILKSTGLVEGITWAAYHIGAKGRLYTIITFFACALFATASGTGFGTIIAGVSLLYPAGVFLGANPVVLVGAIIGGGAFGDNLAPVSDTTICSATSQGADVGGVVRSRLRYAIAASIITLVFMIIFGGSGAGASEAIPYEELSRYMNPKGLIMLIPAIITIYAAIKKGDLIYATTLGTVLSTVVALAANLVTVDQLIGIEDGSVTGIIVEGIGGMVDICILALLIFACVNIMKEGGGDKKLLEVAEKFVKTARGAEASIAALVIVMASIMGLNAPPILAVGTSYAKPIGEKFKIHPYRRANILDGTANTLVYSVPWSTALLLAQSLTKDVSIQYGSAIPIVTADQMWPYVVYCWAMLAVMIFAIITGWGRTYMDAEGNEVKSLS